MNTDDLRRAIEDRGQRPDVHDAIMRRHRAEWPTLWAAIDALLAHSDIPPMPTDPPSFLYRVVEKSGEAVTTVTDDREWCDRTAWVADQHFSKCSPHRVQRTQFHWENVPE